MSRAMHFCPPDHQGASGGISLADTALGWTFTSIIRVVCSVFFWLHHQKNLSVVISPSATECLGMHTATGHSGADAVVLDCHAQGLLTQLLT